MEDYLISLDCLLGSGTSGSSQAKKASAIVGHTSVKIKNTVPWLWKYRSSGFAIWLDSDAIVGVFQTLLDSTSAARVQSFGGCHMWGCIR